MSISKSKILALFGKKLVDNNDDFTMPIATSDDEGKLTVEKYEAFKHQLVDGILIAMQATPFAKRYITDVLNSPKFKLGVSDAENPWTHAYYNREKHCIVFFIREPHFLDGGIEEAFVVFILHEFGHAYFATIHAPKHYPPLLAKKDPLAYDYCTVPYYPITESSLENFDKAIKFSTDKLFWLLKWFKYDPANFEREEPQLFSKIKSALERYVKLPITYDGDCEHYAQEISDLESGKRVTIPNVISLVNDETGAMLIPKRYYRLVRDGKEYCHFMGTVGSASGDFPEDNILAAFSNLNILMTRPHTEAYRRRYASYGASVSHKVMGETLAVLFESNSLLAFYPKIIELHFEDRFSAAERWNLPTKRNEPEIESIISDTKSSSALLKPIRFTRIDKQLRAKEYAINMPTIPELLPEKSAQQIAEDIQAQQNKWAVTLFAAVTAAPQLAGSIVYGILSATEQLERLAYVGDEHSCSGDAESISPLFLVAGVAVAAATAYGFWRCKQSHKETEKKAKVREGEDAPRFRRK